MMLYKKIAHTYLESFMKISREDKKPGDVWDTDKGNFRAMNQEGNEKSFTDREDAEVFAKGSEEGSEEEEETQEGEEETQEGEEEPTEEEDLESLKNKEQEFTNQIMNLIGGSVDRAIGTLQKQNPDVEITEEKREQIRQKVMNRGIRYFKKLNVENKKKDKKMSGEEQAEGIENEVQTVATEMMEGEKKSQEDKKEFQDNVEKYIGDYEKSKKRFLRDSKLKERDVDWGEVKKSYNDAARELSLEYAGGTNLSEFEDYDQNDPRSLAKALAAKSFQKNQKKIDKELSSFRDQRLEKRLDKVLESIQETMGDGIKSVSEQTKDALKNLVSLMNDEDIDSLNAATQEGLKKAKGKVPAIGRNFSISEINKAQQRLEQGFQFDSKNIDAKKAGADLAEQIFAERVILNPEWVGGEKIKNIKVTPKTIKEKATAAYRQYSKLDKGGRKAIARRIKKLLDQEINPESPRYQQLKAVMNGVQLAQMKNGERVSGVEVQPPASVRSLVAELAKNGNEETLLGTAEHMREPEAQRQVARALVQIPDSSMHRALGGNTGPFGPLTKNFSSLPKNKKDFLREFLKSQFKSLMFGSAVYQDAYYEKHGQYPDFGAINKIDRMQNKTEQTTSKTISEIVKGDSNKSVEDLIKERHSSFYKKLRERGQLDFLKKVRKDRKKLERLGRLLSSWETQKAVEKEFGKDAEKTDTYAINNKTLENLNPKIQEMKTDRPLLGDPKSKKANQSSLYTKGLLFGFHKNNLNRRKPLMSLSKKAAMQVTAKLDHVATLIQENYQKLGLTKKVANDFAYRADTISNRIDKLALDELDPVKEKGFDPEEIGREDSGAHESDADEGYMKENFSQQENRELRQLQESGKMPHANPKDRPAQAGKQASMEDSLGNLQKLAMEMGEDSDVHRVGRLLDDLKVCSARLGKLEGAEAKKIAGNLKKHIASLTKLHGMVLECEADENTSLEKEAALAECVGRVERALGEVMPYLQSYCEKSDEIDEESPLAQLMAEDEVDNDGDKLNKLLDIAHRIVSKIIQSASSLKKEASYEPTF